MRRFRVALFDWDGTLFDSRALNHGAVVEIFKRFKLLPPTEEEYFSGISADYMGFYYSRGIPRDSSPDSLNEIRKEFMRKNWGKTPLHDDAVKMLIHLKDDGLKIGIISAENSDILKERVKQKGLARLLDCLTGDAFDKRMAIWETLEVMRLEPEDCFFVDDSPRDILKIKESGVFTIGITHGFGSPQKIAEAQPDLIVSSLQKIIEFVDSDT